MTEGRGDERRVLSLKTEVDGPCLYSSSVERKKTDTVSEGYAKGTNK